jgi:hypothetical protein
VSRRWVAPVIYGVLGAELAVVTGFAVAYNALDFRIYMWGGHAVTHDTRLYLDLAYGHWFTYAPFAAVVFVPFAALPLAVARLLWDLASVAALALDPVWQTLFLGQINLLLLALILTDVWRVARGLPRAGFGVGVAAAAHVGAWWVVIPVGLALAGLGAAVVLARRGDWLGAAVVTGCTGLLVSPVSWAHHWVWILPALVLLVRDGHRVFAGVGYVLFAVAPFWFTPHSGGPHEYGFHGLVTLVANCYLIAGLAFLAYMGWRAVQGGQGQGQDLGPVLAVEGAVAEPERGHGGALDDGQRGVGVDHR